MTVDAKWHRERSLKVYVPMVRSSRPPGITPPPGPRGGQEKGRATHSPCALSCFEFLLNEWTGMEGNVPPPPPGLGSAQG